VRRAGLVAVVALGAVLPGCGGAAAPRDPAGDTRLATWRDANGDGRLERGPGEPVLGRARTTGRPLATFVQITDPHVRDIASPARIPFLDRLGPPFGSTFRPQEALTLPTLEAAVESADALHPDAVVVTGDIADNAQRNELVAALRTLRGGVVRLDSGRPGPGGPQLRSDPDPFFYRPDVDAPRHPGLLEAAARPFRSPGLDAPWHPVLGNHDLLVAGEVAPDAATQAAATGDRAVTRLDLGALRGLDVPRAAPGGEGGQGPIGADVVARVLRAGRAVPVAGDPARREVTPAEAETLFRRFSGQPSLASFPLGGGVRGIALDLVNRRGGSGAALTPGTLLLLRHRLAAAGSAPVVVFSHQPLPPAALSILERDPHVLAAVAGHTHRNAIRRRGRLWTITTASLADFPEQVRAFRVWRAPDGGHVLDTWMLDTTDGPDGLAKTSRELAFLDAQGGRPGGFAGTRADRNRRLRAG
jgi:hypothetical protein